MSSRKLDVDVFDCSRRVERLSQRPVRLMPDKRAGVVYGGDIYPLHRGDRIDLADRPVKKELCPGFVAPSAPIPYAVVKVAPPASRGTAIRLDRWYLESNRFGHYLVFDAPAPTAKKVAGLMETAGLGVRRWDESVRESDNGESYDWFIRLEFGGSREECLQRIRTALGFATSSSNGAAPVPTVTAFELKKLRLEVLELRTDNLGLRTDAALQKVTADIERKRLTEELNAAKTASTKLRRQLGELRAKSNAEREQLRAQVADLDQRLSRVRQATLAEPHGDTVLQKALEAKKEAEDHYFEAQQSADEWEDRAQKLEGDMEMLHSHVQAAESEAKHYRERLEQVEAELTETRNEARERRSAVRAAGGPPQGPVERFLSKLFPRIDLDADAVETLLGWPRPGAAVDFLRQVDARADPRGKKPVAKKTGWWEIPKVNTGRAGKAIAGRIYYSPTKDDRVVVVLHDKEDDKEQERFIARLPDCA